MAAAPDRDRQHSETLASLLGRPDGLVCALASDGFRIPLPASLPVGAQRQIPLPADRATMLDLIVPQDAMTVVTTWESVRVAGVAHAVVHLRSEPARAVTLTFVDAMLSHGVWIGALTEETTQQAQGSASVLAGSLAIPVRPRTATVHKSSLGVITAIDERTSRMLGWTGSQMIGTRSTEFVHPDDQERAIASWLEMLAKQQTTRIRLRHRSADGSWLWVECENEYLPAEDPADAKVIAQLSDISDEMAIHDALDRRERLLQRVAESVPVGLAQISSDQQLVYANARISTMLGTPDAKTWEALLATVSEPDLGPVSAAIEQALVGNRDSVLEVTIRQPVSGETRICSLSLVSLSDREGTAGALLCLADITDSAQLRETLRARATFDVLTGCFNRASITSALDDALSSNNGLTAVIFIDLDKFKTVNDSYGHAAGDELLIHAAAQLRGVLRHGDTLGRIGGDEFLIVSTGLTSAEAAISLAERVHIALHKPVALTAGLIEARASIGVATSEPGMDSTTLTQRADLAMYQSKQDGHGHPVLYDTTRHSLPTIPGQPAPEGAVAHRSTRSRQQPVQQ